jgi:uncharacterized membrane protein
MLESTLMSFVDGLARLLHIAGAMAWFGGALIVATRLLPAMRSIGDAAIPLQQSIARSRGMTPFFVPVSLITILAGGHLYGNMRVFEWEGVNRIMIDIGMTAGTIAFILGFVMIAPIERKIARMADEMDSPSAGNKAIWNRLFSRLHLWNHIVLGLVTVAVFGMAGRQIFL